MPISINLIPKFYLFIKLSLRLVGFSLIISYSLIYLKVSPYVLVRKGFFNLHNYGMNY
jgi:hypothetical protein